MLQMGNCFRFHAIWLSSSYYWDFKFVCLRDTFFSFLIRKHFSKQSELSQGWAREVTELSLWRTKSDGSLKTGLSSFHPASSKELLPHSLVTEEACVNAHPPVIPWLNLANYGSYYGNDLAQPLNTAWSDPHLWCFAKGSWLPLKRANSGVTKHKNQIEEKIPPIKLSGAKKKKFKICLLKIRCHPQNTNLGESIIEFPPLGFLPSRGLECVRSKWQKVTFGFFWIFLILFFCKLLSRLLRKQLLRIKVHCLCQAKAYPL